MDAQSTHYQAGALRDALRDLYRPVWDRARGIRGREAVTLVPPSGGTVSASIAGRDPSTDIVVLKASDVSSALPEFVEAAQLKVGNVVLALGRRESGLSASYGIVGSLGGAWRTWQGGRIDQWLRLDLNPYPGFSGGPLVDTYGRVLGTNTSGPHRSVMTIPKSTVDRVVDQLPPGLDPLAHRLEIPLHALHVDRDRIHERKALRVFREQWLKVTMNNMATPTLCT